MLRTKLLIASALLIAGILPVSAAPKEGKKVIACYYPWYGTPQVSGQWAHWNEGNHNPDSKLPNGMPDTGTSEHPKFLYDSGDASVVRAHLKSAEAAGIDALAASWWGPGHITDKNFSVLLKEAAKSPVKIAIYYEAVPEARSVEATAAQFDALLSRCEKSTGTFRYQNRPVIFIYSRAMGQLSPEQWAQVVRKVRSKHAAYLIADAGNAHWLQIFDGLHSYNPLSAVLAKADMGKEYRALVAPCRKAGKLSVATVIPGYDDTNIGRKGAVRLDRENGELYRRLWREAIKAQPDMVLITSFNEWHEGSEIEPSRENGTQALEQTGIFAKFYKGSSANGIAEQASLASQKWTPVRKAGQMPLISVTKASRGCVLIENMDSSPATVTGFVGAAKPVIFELGKNARHLRAISVSPNAKGIITLRLAGATSYEVWDTASFLRYVGSTLDSATKKAAGITKALQTPAQIHKAYAAISKDPKQIVAKMLLADASDAVLGLQAKLSGESPRPDPDAYNLFNGYPFKLKATLRNQGTSTLKNVQVRLMVPEDWTLEPKDTKLLAGLAPKQTAEVSYIITASSRTDSDTPIPAIAWITYEADGVTVKTQTNCILEAISPMEFDAAFANSSTNQSQFRVLLKSNFPQIELPNVRAAILVPDGWKVEGDGVSPNPRIAGEYEQTLNLKGNAAPTFVISRPDGDRPDLKTIRIRGYIGENLWGKRIAFEGYCALAKTNDSKGVTLVDAADGTTQPATIEKQECRLLAKADASKPAYAYFNLDERFLPGETWVSVEYLDKGQGRFRIQYDSQDGSLATLEASYKPSQWQELANSGEWKTAIFHLPDAAMTGRQNGGADLRISAESNEALAVRKIGISKMALQ